MTALRSETVDPAGLSGADRDRWVDIQARWPPYASPFLTPTFTELVAHSRRDVRVAVMRDGDRTVGFLPYQAGRRRNARPVGHKIADYQGPVMDPEVDWDARDLLEAAGLQQYVFDHALAAQAQLAPFFEQRAVSPVIDLSHGFEHYRRKAREAGMRGPKDISAQARRLARERGGVRFEFHDTDPRTVDALLEWKAAQYRRTGAFDALSVPWVSDVLRRAAATSADDCSGVVSSLYVGDSLAAVHLGLRSRHVLHWWFPAYNQDLARHSPGLVLLLCVAEAANEMAVTSIDLGRGEAPYKRRLATTGIELGIGSVARERVDALSRLSSAARRQVRRARLGPHVARYLAGREFR